MTDGIPLALGNVGNNADCGELEDLPSFQPKYIHQLIRCFKGEWAHSGWHCASSKSQITTFWNGSPPEFLGLKVEKVHQPKIYSLSEHDQDLHCHVICCVCLECLNQGLKRTGEGGMEGIFVLVKIC